MAGSVNKVILIGNLGADPENRHTQDGRSIANLRIATSESWRDKATGERKEKTEWHRVVIFNGESLQGWDRRFSSRGNCRRANGRINLARTAIRPTWGVEGFRGELTLLDRAGRRERRRSCLRRCGVGSTAAAPKAASAGGVRRSSADMDDEIPF